VKLYVFQFKYTIFNIDAEGPQEKLEEVASANIFQFYGYLKWYLPDQCWDVQIKLREGWQPFSELKRRINKARMTLRNRRKK